MQADEAADMMDKDRESDKFKQRAAVAIAFFAMLLAITGLGGNNATKDALNSNIQASNLFNFYQAKNQRQMGFELAADYAEFATLHDPDLPAEQKEHWRKKLETYRKTVARYESEPETNEGKKELLVKAREETKKRDIALRKDPYFDYAEALLQISIVLISVSIIAGVAWLAFFGGAIGIVGGLLMINGFLLLVAIPGLE